MLAALPDDARLGLNALAGASGLSVASVVMEHSKVGLALPLDLDDQEAL